MTCPLSNQEPTNKKEGISILNSFYIYLSKVAGLHFYAAPNF